ncbi:unnamed protein product [Bathycoccus prasinos]
MITSFRRAANSTASSSSLCRRLLRFSSSSYESDNTFNGETNSNFNSGGGQTTMHFNSTGSGMFREIDTLALTRQLQKNDIFTEKQAEEAVRMFVSCLKSADFVTHAELQVEAQRNRHKFERYQMISDARIERANVKSETVEKDLKQEAEKIRSELRYNFEKMNQTSRLDLNLEKGRMQDNLTLIDNKLLSTELRLDREIQSMRTHLEIKVNDIIRYGLGTLVSVGALGLGFLRFLT